MKIIMKYLMELFEGEFDWNDDSFFKIFFLLSEIDYTQLESEL